MIRVALLLAASALPAVASAQHSGSKSDAEAVREVQKVGRCLAADRPADVHTLILMDYHSKDYGRLTRKLEREQDACTSRNGQNWKSSGLLYAGALAEGALHERGVVTRLAEATAHNPALPPIQTRSAGDYFGYCVVRKDPAKVAALFATEAASPAELDALKQLGPDLSSCVAAGHKTQFTRESIRSLLALNAYRLFAHNEGGAR